MSTVLTNPHYFALALVAVFATCLGVGLTLGKGGGALLSKIKGNEGKVSVSVNPPAPEKAKNECLECLQNINQLLPCKEHSGIVADVKHTLAATNRIEANVGKVWQAVDGLCDDVKDLIRAQAK